ncbi:MAG TPA: hypothetical protein VG711_02820 [Phycisphaerales bacterium]|nr:hypothetical protein [Phycisphaerales bacterium]
MPAFKGGDEVSSAEVFDAEVVDFVQAFQTAGSAGSRKRHAGGLLCSEFDSMSPIDAVFNPLPVEFSGCAVRRELMCRASEKDEPSDAIDPECGGHGMTVAHG